MIRTEMFDKDGNPINAKIVPDGGKLRTRMTMMDAAPPDVAAITKAAMMDAERPQAAMHRPGSANITATDRALREQALDARDKRLVDAWKGPAAVNASQIQKPALTTPTGDAADRRDARLRDAWRK